MSLKILLFIEFFWILATLLFVIIATALKDWSKSGDGEYGIWRVCIYNVSTSCDQGDNWWHTELPELKDCEGAWIATQAFSVVSIIWTGFIFLFVIAMIGMASLITKANLLINICLNLCNFIWTLCGWVMWLGVDDRDICIYQDSDTHLGSCWFLQFFAWLFSIITFIISILLFLKWKKTPRFAGPPQFVPGPQVAGGGFKGGAVPYFPEPYAYPPAYPSTYPPAPYSPSSAYYSGVQYPAPPSPIVAGQPAAYYPYASSPGISHL